MFSTQPVKNKVGYIFSILKTDFTKINIDNQQLIKIRITALPSFQTSEKIITFLQQDVSLYAQTFQVLPTKTILPFLQKGEKTAELVFLDQSGIIIQMSPI